MKIENLEKGCKKISNILNFVFTNRSDLYIIVEYEIERFLYAPLAQLDRVAHYECEGWGFESLMAHQRNPVIAMITGFSFFEAIF